MGFILIVCGILILFNSIEQRPKPIMSAPKKRKLLIAFLLIISGIVWLNSDYFDKYYSKMKNEYKYPFDMNDR